MLKPQPRLVQSQHTVSVACDPSNSTHFLQNFSTYVAQLWSHIRSDLTSIATQNPTAEVTVEIQAEIAEMIQRLKEKLTARKGQLKDHPELSLLEEKYNTPSLFNLSNYDELSEMSISDSSFTHPPHTLSEIIPEILRIASKLSQFSEEERPRLVDTKFTEKNKRKNNIFKIATHHLAKLTRNLKRLQREDHKLDNERQIKEALGLAKYCQAVISEHLGRSSQKIAPPAFPKLIPEDVQLAIKGDERLRKSKTNEEEVKDEVYREILHKYYNIAKLPKITLEKIRPVSANIYAAIWLTLSFLLFIAVCVMALFLTNFIPGGAPIAIAMVTFGAGEAAIFLLLNKYESHRQSKITKQITSHEKDSATPPTAAHLPVLPPDDDNTQKKTSSLGHEEYANLSDDSDAESAEENSSGLRPGTPPSGARHVPE